VNPLTQLRVPPEIVEAIHWTNHETGGRVASEPFDRDLDSFTFAFWMYHHTLDNLTHNLFAVGHGGCRCLPKGWNVVSELFDRVTLGRQEHLRLGVQKTLVIFLELAMSGEPLFPLVGQLPSHQAIFRLLCSQEHKNRYVAPSVMWCPDISHPFHT
jgi:hypothetical protein